MTKPRHRHSLAFANPGNGFTDANGRSVKEGDRCQYLDGRECFLDEALHDGDAFVTFTDGTHDTVKWRNLAKFPEKNDD